MPRPTLLQSLLQQPTTKYSGDYKYTSPATSAAARRRGAASDAGSIYSLGDSDTDSLFAGSIKSSQSLGRPSKRSSRIARRGQVYNHYASSSSSQDHAQQPSNASPNQQQQPFGRHTEPSWLQESPRRRRRSIVSVRDLEVGYQPPPQKDLPETPSQAVAAAARGPEQERIPEPSATTSSYPPADPIPPASQSGPLVDSPSRSYLRYQSPSQVDLQATATSGPPPVPCVPPAHDATTTTTTTTNATSMTHGMYPPVPAAPESQQISTTRDVAGPQTSLQPDHTPWQFAPRSSKRLSLVAEDPELPTPPAIERGPEIFSRPPPQPAAEAIAVASASSSSSTTTIPIPVNAATAAAAAAAPKPQPEAETSQPILSPLAPRPQDAFVLTAFDLLLPSARLTGKVASNESVCSVALRFTTDNWKSHRDAAAVVEPVTAAATGMFTFSITETLFQPGDTVHCAVRMYNDAADVWDSDNGKNFSFVVPISAAAATAAAPVPEPTKQHAVKKTDSLGSESFRSAVSNSGFSAEPSDVVENVSSPPSQAPAPAANLLPAAPPAGPLDEPSDVFKQQHGVPASAYSTASAPRIFLSRSESQAAGLQEVYPEGTPPAQRVLAASMFVNGNGPSDDMPEPIRYAAPVARRGSPSTQLGQQTVPNLERNVQRHNDEPLSRRTSSSSSSRGTALRDGFGPNVVWPAGEAMPAPPLPNFTPPPPHSSASVTPQPIPLVNTSSSNAHLNTRSSAEHLHGPGLSASPIPKTVSRSSSIGRDSSSLSVRRAFVKDEWTPEALGSPSSSTMCALAISRPAPSTSNSFNPEGGAGVSLSPPASPTKRFFGGGKKAAQNQQPAKQLAWSAYKVSFVTNAQLPDKIKAGQVLVQVLATAIDHWDQSRVRELSRRSDGLGFVPGRSFYGKLLQVGADCKLHAGQFVFGMTVLEQSRALAELIVVDKSRVTLAPSCNLSAEQMAALPIMGVPAAATVLPIANALPKNTRVLVIDAAAGAGSMIVQLFRALRPERDVYIAVQVAPSTLDAEALGERLGADDVFRDDALEALSRFNDSTFDVVIDCIGGKRVYEAARRTLRADGTFATLVGDSPGSGNTEKRTFASNLRSLRSAFKRREHKRVNYWMPMLAVMDPRDYLDVVREQVEQKGLVPEVSKVWRFEHAPEAFASQQRLVGSHVVRVLER